MGDGATVQLGTIRFEVLETPGHSPESISILVHDLPLPDDTLVYPAHGAGSLCGKNLSTDTVSTIGVQRRYNYVLQPMSRDARPEAVTSLTRRRAQAADAGRRARARRRSRIRRQPAARRGAPRARAVQRPPR